MGKIRVKTLGDEASEKKQLQSDKTRREEKKLKKKTHVSGVGLKGGQQVTLMEGDELKPEFAQSSDQDTQTKTKDKKKSNKASKIRSKRYKEIQKLVEVNKLYPLSQALELVKKTATTKFDGTVEVHLNLNPELFSPEKKTISGAINLPYGTGKKRIIVIADETTIENVAKGIINFAVLLAHPSLMPKLAKVARILGPKGLMPNPKNGTVTADPQKRAKELEGGEITWKNEPDHPVLHQAVGKVSFTAGQLEDNIKTLFKSIGRAKVLKFTLSSSMGPGIKVDTSTL